MANGRKLIITRPKKFVGAATKYIVYVDGQNIGNVRNGETATCLISTNAHSVCVVNYYDNGSAQSNDVYVPANDLDYHFNISVKTGLLSPVIELTEDAPQAAYNRQILEKRNKINDIVTKVDAVMKPILESNPVGERDFSPINNLAYEYKNSDYFKGIIDTLRKEYYKNLAIKCFDTGMGHSKIYSVLKEIASFTGENIATFESLKHYDYMMIDNNLFNSVLSLDTIEDLNQIRSKESLKELKEDFTMAYTNAKNMYELEFYEQSINRLLFTKFTDDDLDNAKRWLLFASLNEGVEKEASDFYDFMMRLNKIAFGDHVRGDNNRKIEIKSVDMIIAEALRFSYVNSIDKINDSLDDFLNVGCKCFNIGQEQYNILLNIFTFLNAYKQEEMVLEAMVSNCIERTAAQEERLSFLKNKQRSSYGVGSSTYKPVVIEEVPDDKIVYEYRSITWKETDIINYFDSLSMQNQTIFIPFVINEWSKNINAVGIKWEIENVATRLDQVLQDNFDNRFKVNIIESGPTGNYTEYDKTALIVDSIPSGYPWITFNVVGEQMMKNQVTLSVYAMYTPALDESLGESKIERNSVMCNKILMLNQKQNPKINNYMTNVTDLIIRELEKWINTQNESNIYG